MSHRLPNLRAGKVRARIIWRTVAGVQRTITAASSTVR